MILETTCYKCRFLNEHSCSLGKETELKIEQDIVVKTFTQGFCKDKRTNDWSGDLDKENSQIDMIIIDNKNIVDHYKNNGNIRLIIFGKSFEDYKSLLSTVKNQWNFTKTLDENIQLNENSIFDYCLDNKLIKNRWMMFLKEPIDLRPIYEKLLSNESILGLYSNKYIVINRLAFEEMNGNQDTLFINKLKEFENWESSWIQMP